jgi:tetratricopeptide (TPR) repeat protein
MGNSAPKAPKTVRDTADAAICDPHAKSERSWWLWAETGIFFLMVAGYVWFVIDPRLIHHTIGILTPYHAFSFSTGWAFFVPFLGRPGGLVDYGARFLTPCFRYGWLGALIITVLAWLGCWGVDSLNRRAGLAGGSLLRYGPPVILLVMFGSYGHPLQILLSLAVGLGCLLLSWRVTPQGAVRAAAVLSLGSLFAYYVAGAGGLLFSVLAVMDRVLVRRQTRVGLVVLLAGLSLPGLVGSRLFHLSLRQAYADYLLVPDAEWRLWNWSCALLLYGYFPAVLAGAVLYRAVLARRSPGVKRCSNRPASAAASMPRGVLQLAAVLLGAVGIARWMLHTDGLPAFESDYYCQQQMWPEALDAAARMPEGEYDSRYNRNILLALYHTGRLGDELFRYPQAPGVAEYDMLEGQDSHTYFQQSRFFLELGLVNEAEKCGQEAFALEGEMPSILQHLAEIHLVKEQPETARVFLNALRQKLFHRQAAEQRLQRLDETPLLADDPRVAQIRRRMVREDRAFLIVDYEASLLRLLDKNPDNRMAFEFLMAHYLCVARPDKVVENLPRLPRFGYCRIPRHFQEAMLLEAGRSGRLPATGELPLDPATLARAKAFFEILQSTPNRERALRKAIEAGFGDSYFCYYRFGVSGLSSHDP